MAPAQVAERAGHSVEVLLRIYVRCLNGQHDIAKRRIMDAHDDPARNDGKFHAAEADDEKQGHTDSVPDRGQEDPDGDRNGQQ